MSVDRSLGALAQAYGIDRPIRKMRAHDKALIEAINEESASDRQVGGGHYKDMAIEPSEFIFRNGLNWLEGNAIKYICRHSAKNGETDIDKAIHYLELLKEWQYAAKTK